jgi:hypothetical protein
MFSVWVERVGYVKAKLRGDLFVRSLQNPLTVEEGRLVLVEDLGLGHMARGITWQIMGVPLDDQAIAIRGMIRARSSSSSGPEGFRFNRGEQAAAAATVRANLMRQAVASRVVENAGITNAASGNNASASSSETVDLSVLERNAKVAAKAAKLTRRRERRAAKRAGGGQPFW